MQRSDEITKLLLLENPRGRPPGCARLADLLEWSLYRARAQDRQDTESSEELGRLHTPRPSPQVYSGERARDGAQSSSEELGSNLCRASRTRRTDGCKRSTIG